MRPIDYFADRLPGLPLAGAVVDRGPGVKSSLSISSEFTAGKFPLAANFAETAVAKMVTTAEDFAVGFFAAAFKNR